MEWTAQTMTELSVNRNYIGEYCFCQTNYKVLSHKKPSWFKRTILKLFFNIKWVDFNNKK